LPLAICRGTPTPLECNTTTGATLTTSATGYHFVTASACGAGFTQTAVFCSADSVTSGYVLLDSGYSGTDCDFIQSVASSITYRGHWPLPITLRAHWADQQATFRWPVFLGGRRRPNAVMPATTLTQGLRLPSASGLSRRDASETRDRFGSQAQYADASSSQNVPYLLRHLAMRTAKNLFRRFRPASPLACDLREDGS